MFANGPGDLGSIPGRVIPKTQKMVLDASLLNTHHYKVRIKGKLEQSREGVAPSPTPWCSSYRKGGLRVTLDYGRQLYLLIFHLCCFWLCNTSWQDPNSWYPKGVVPAVKSAILNGTKRLLHFLATAKEDFSLTFVGVCLRQMKPVPLILCSFHPDEVLPYLVETAGNKKPVKPLYESSNCSKQNNIRLDKPKPTDLVINYNT